MAGYERWQEEMKYSAGRPHGPDHELLLPIPTATGVRPTRKTKSIPSPDFEKAIEIYFKWFTSLHLDPQQRYNMMLNSTPTDAINREITLIRIIRQLCPGVRVDMNKSDMGWSEKHNAVYLLLHLNGEHIGSLKDVRPTNKTIIADAMIFIKVDENAPHKFRSLRFMFDDILFFKQIGFNLGDLHKIKGLGI